MPREHFVEIEFVEKGAKRIYRFYGLGRWKLKDGNSWRQIDGIFVPGDVLKAAAAQCKQMPVRLPPLMLSEKQIAALVGGKI